MNKKPLIVIAGPTASGKTSVSVALAKAIGGEIISADSMQVYKGMDIGTAKVTQSEMDGVPHHLIDVLSPDEGCSIAKFQSMVKDALEDIYSRGKIPILAGGTGFYIQAIVNDIAFEETPPDLSYRHSLETIAAEEGGDTLYEELKAVDPASAIAIHSNNTKRIIRALEYHHFTGERISDHNEVEKEKTSPYNLAFYVLTMERGRLYERINHRVDLMLEEGLVDEVQGLLNQGYTLDLVSMQGLGYKEIVGAINKESSLEAAVELLKRDTRRFAKRQLTWFRREKQVQWLDLDEFGSDIGAVVNFISKDIEEKKIL